MPPSNPRKNENRSASITWSHFAVLVLWMHLFTQEVWTFYPITLMYRAKLCRAKLFVWRNFLHQTKNSLLSPDEKFRPNKSKSVLKWGTNERTSDLSHLDKLWLYGWAKVCRAKFSSGEIFVTFQKIRHFARQCFTK